MGYRLLGLPAISAFSGAFLMGGRFQPWSGKDLALLHRHRCDPLEVLCQLFPGRSLRAIEGQLTRRYPGLRRPREDAPVIINDSPYRRLRAAVAHLVESVAEVYGPYQRLSLAIVRNEVISLGKPEEEPWALVDGSLDPHLDNISIDPEWFRETVVSSGLLTGGHIRRIKNWLKRLEAIEAYEQTG